jgi:hypothetical protein
VPTPVLTWGERAQVRWERKPHTFGIVFLIFSF